MPGAGLVSGLRVSEDFFCRVQDLLTPNTNNHFILKFYFQRKMPEAGLVSGLRVSEVFLLPRPRLFTPKHKRINLPSKLYFENKMPGAGLEPARPSRDNRF